MRLGTSSSISSPSRTSASGPPTADSGDTCSTTVPYDVPLIRASEIRTMSFTPFCRRRAGMGAAPHSGMPGAPLGPTCLSTSTEVSSIGEGRIVDARVQVGVVLEHHGAARGG